ncbi:hypothetical protein PC123_g28708 [Phytophthora cactorum]|nr:hypothetical protein PC123_g28708 [Phytophthora cactorum]
MSCGHCARIASDSASRLCLFSVNNDSSRACSTLTVSAASGAGASWRTASSFTESWGFDAFSSSWARLPAFQSPLGRADQSTLDLAARFFVSLVPKAFALQGNKLCRARNSHCSSSILTCHS